MTEELYIAVMFNKHTSEIVTKIYDSIESFGADSKQYEIMSYFNITGKDIEIKESELVGSVEVK